MTKAEREHLEKVARRNCHRKDFDAYMRSKLWTDEEIELMHKYLAGLKEADS